MYLGIGTVGVLYELRMDTVGLMYVHVIGFSRLNVCT